ncbi:MAG: ABC transporter permease [Rhodothermales bacterium]
MRFSDLFRFALANLWRNRARSLMTLVGVLIGVAALMALLSYGVGVQENARNEFNNLELYNTLRITTRPSPINSMGDLAVRRREDKPRLDSLPTVALTDSLLQLFARIDGVLAAYPEVTFPVELNMNGREVVASAEAIPMAFGDLPAYQPEVGHFFSAASDSAVLLAPSMARRLGFDDPAALVGQTITINTIAISVPKMLRPGQALQVGLTALPLNQVPHSMRVAGLLREEGQPFSGFFRVLVPLERAKRMQKITFFSVVDLLLRDPGAQGYPAVRVQLESLDAYESARQAIEEHGVFVTSFREQFSQLERLFLILDLALGIIGFIALLVATIGIANTMMMNVLERYREIGVMKAVGGDERDLQKLFLIESAALGFIGGSTGLLVGWSITTAIQFVVDYYLYRLGIPAFDVFHLPVWMWLSILTVAVFVSLLAGLAPARKAARVDPIEALRGV